MKGSLKMTRRLCLITGVIIVIVILLIVVRGNLYESIFSVLGWVKEKSGEQVNIEELYKSESSPPDHVLWDELVKSLVDLNGWVNYKGFLIDKKKLGEYLNELSTHPPSHSWVQEEELAYWINAYNAFTIQLILDHYPVKSIKDIGGSIPMVNSPWDIKFFEIGGVPVDLNTIEHDILRNKISDPRIHFALNCASISCPVLRNEAYIPDKIHQQLEDQAIRFINDTSRNKLTETTVELSSIFNWFRNDFEKEQSLTQYVSKYAISEISPNSQIKWLEYNWALNEINQ